MQQSFGMDETRGHLRIATKHLARAAETFERIESDLEILLLKTSEGNVAYEPIRDAANGICEAACYARQAVECLGYTCGDLMIW